MALQDVTLFIYNLALLPIIFFSVLFFMIAFLNLFMDKKKEQFRKIKDYPFVSVQVPTFNDPVALRCIKRCLKFDYPKDRYEIVIVDDSTNIRTQTRLKDLASKYPGFVKFIHRDNREGFKPGALKNAMKITKGEIIVIFDADWIPAPGFLREVVAPFADPKVAIVQTRQGFSNKDKNLITRFASYLLITYHQIIMPINNRINCVFFCGTAGAIRRKPFIEAGGWNLNSITEDSDLSVKILQKKYRSVYLDIETPSEVPETFESFIKQQMRWCYGNVRVFMDNPERILIDKGLTFSQRLMITFITLGSLTAPIVLIMTIFGFTGWFVGEPSLFNPKDLVVLGSRFLYTAGFLFMGGLALYKAKIFKEFPKLILGSFTIGLILSVANTVAFTRAIFNRRLHWFCTPKAANTLYEK